MSRLHIMSSHSQGLHAFMIQSATLLLLLMLLQSLSSLHQSTPFCFAWTPILPLQQQRHVQYKKFGSRLYEASPSFTVITKNDTATLTSSWVQNNFEQVANANDATTPSKIKANDSIDVAADVDINSKVIIGPKQVLVYDTTLRDGTQGESVSASVDDKLKIFQRLAAFNVDYIEAGWPGSNPKDVEFFARAQTLLSKHECAKLVAFGSTRRKRVAVQDDTQIQALLDSNAPTVCIVAKAHLWQVTDILQASPLENLDMISESVAYLKQQGRTVMVDLEHFFDGYKYNAEYALRCAQAAADAGAVCLVLCDTNGGTLPWQVSGVVDHVMQHFDRKTTIGIHCHNDCNLAVANSLTAAQHGVGLIQGTLNGLGERTGNADLCSIVPTLGLHMESKMTCTSHLKDLTSLSRFVDEILNRTPNHSAPYVGASAFAHKGGLHVAAMERSPLSYQHCDPAAVGNEKRILVSELSGRQNIIDLMNNVIGGVEGVSSNQIKNERALAVLKRVKQLESQGYTFEGAEASVQLMILHSTRGYCPPFSVLDYSAHVYDAHMDSASRVLWNQAENDENSGEANTNGRNKIKAATARATVRVRTRKPMPDGLGSMFMTEEDLYQENLEVGDGNGPVDALGNALLRALVPVHPSLKQVELVDYKVRILDPASATRAATRVLIEFRDTSNDKTWTTVSVDTNVISASLNALVDGLEYALIEYADSCVLCDEDFE